MADSDRTLQIDVGGFLRGALRTSLACVFFLAAFEAAARSPWAVAHLPGPDRGTRHAMFDAKLTLLERFVAREGGVDCLFLGTSAVHRSIDPDVVASAYGERTGRTIRCFNFSILGITPEALGRVAAILIDLYEPSLLIWGTGALDFFATDPRLDVREYRFERIWSSPWYRVHTGDVSLGWWLAVHSRAAGHVARVSDEIRRRRSARRDKTPMTASGYLPSKSRGMRRNRKPTERWDAITASELRISSDLLASAAPLFDLHSRVLIVLVALPINEPALATRPLEVTAAFRREADGLAERLAQRGVPYWRGAEWGLLGTRDWSDYIHTNSRGADAFSSWLGGRMGDAVVSGEIPDPARRRTRSQGPT